ncbi:hypothetical protein BJV74DRAFT_889846 [Russula compacta]|nr:hypothetical protein BJV74DRAFT_889846 [Russula compacta]
MSTPNPSTSRSNVDSIFISAFQAYKKKTRKDITSHPLATELQTCGSPDAILALLRRQIPSSSQSQSENERFTKWLTPTVNVVYSFSATLCGSAGLVNITMPLPLRIFALTVVCQVFPPPNAIFTGIGVLLLAAKDVKADQETLINLFNRIEYFFLRLVIYTEVPPTTAMTAITVDIMVEVLTIVALATKEMKYGRLKKYFKKLMGNTDLEDSLQRLDNLTQEEARMGLAELKKVTHNISG